MIKGCIADIERTSYHDGKGIRTTVFFKGCPLNCAWCHNPECISFGAQSLFYQEKCIGCNMCDKGCYSGARVTCGKDMTASEVINEILLDKPYYTQGGGVTFSGGEPLAQAEFLKECITLCKQNGISVAVETSLIYYHEEIFKSLDFIMADFKIWDSATHKKYVGVPNEIIKENFKKLNSLNIPIIARTPLIPEIEQGIEEISKLLYSLENVVEYEILPYHPIGNSKRIALGLEPDGFTVPSKEFLKEKSKYVFVRRKA